MAERPRAAAWLALTAPGVLVSRSVVTLTLILAPILSARVYTEATVRYTAAVLLLMHLLSTLAVLRSRRQGPAALATFGSLTIDALLCGFVVGAGPGLHGPAVPIVMVVLALSFQTGGSPAVLLCAVATLIGAAATWSAVGTPLLFSPTPSFSTALSVETVFAGQSVLPAVGPAFLSFPDVASSFAGAMVGPPPQAAFTTVLSVETSFASVPGIGSPEALFMPALALALVAVGVGSGLNLWCVREARAVDAALTAA